MVKIGEEERKLRGRRMNGEEREETEAREEHKINKGKNKLSRNRRKRIEHKELTRVRKR